MPSQLARPEPDPYATLAPADREWLRDRTAAIRFISKRALADLVQIGKTLAEAKARLKHGQFTTWVELALPLDLRAAQKLMQVAEAFAGVAAATPATMPLLDVGAAYYLAQTTTPPEARAYAVQLAADGERVTLAAAKEIVAAQRERTAALTASDAKALAPVDRDHERAGEAEREKLAAIGAALVKLLATAAEEDGTGEATDGDDAAVYLKVSADRTGLLSVAGTYYPPGPPSTTRLRHHHAADLLTTLKALAGDDVTKRCAKCQEHKAPNLFARDALQRDGLNRYCKACERVRYAAAKKRKREFKAAQKPSDS